MDWYTFNGIMSLLIALTLSKVVLSPSIDEGAIIKTGLIAMIFSLFGMSAHMFQRTQDADAMARTSGSLVAGVGIVLLGILLKFRARSPFFSFLFGGK